MRVFFLSMLAVICVIVVMTAVVSAAPPAYTSWQVASGGWGTASNWDDGVPTSGKNAYIINNGTCAIGSGDTATAKILTLGGTSVTGYINMTGGNLAFTECYVGKFGVGGFTQTGGNVSGQLLNLGYSSGDGTYSISGGGLSLSSELRIGAGRFEVIGSNPTIATDGDLFSRGDISYVMDSVGVSPISLTTDDGIVSIDGTLSLDFSAMTSATDDIVLIDNYGFDPLNGEFTGSNRAEGDIVHTFSDGSWYSLTYFYPVGSGGLGFVAANDLALVAHAVPEPSSLILLSACLIAGLLGCAWRKRRR